MDTLRINYITASNRYAQNLSETAACVPVGQVIEYTQEPAEDRMIDNYDRQNNLKRTPYRVLLAEDDWEMRALLTQSLHRSGLNVVDCPDGWDLIEHIESQLVFGDKAENIDIIVSDIRMPGPSGMEVLRDLGKVKGFPPMVLITAFGDDKTHYLAAKLGAAAIFDKPFDVDKLLAKVHEILNS